MKKLLLLCTFSILTLSFSFGQKGLSFVVANIGVDNYKIVNDDYTKIFTLGLGYGYHITEPMAVGAEFNYLSFKVKNALNKSSSTSWSAGPFVRSTFPLSDLISLICFKKWTLLTNMIFFRILAWKRDYMLYPT